MGEGIFDDLEYHFQDLKFQRDSGQISQKQFLTEVGNLQIQDERGIWWTIDPVNGNLLYYDSEKWNSVALSAEEGVQELPWNRIALVFALLLSIVLCIIITIGVYYVLVVLPTLTQTTLPQSFFGGL
jgi:hypothetical protein